MENPLPNALKHTTSNRNCIANIFKNVEFTNDEIDYIELNLERVELSKGTHLLKIGNIVENQYYVLSGCLRTYFTDPSAKEHTIQFAIHDWWISDYTGYFTSSNATLEIETLQDSVLIRMSKTTMDDLCMKIPKLETYFRKKMEGAFAAFQKRILSNLSETAAQRYVNFVTQYPIIEQNIKNYHIASYLGITTESLSRIRKELSQH